MVMSITIQPLKKRTMKRFKVIYKGFAHKTWTEMYKIVTAVSKEDARIKADLWEGVIIDIYEI